MTCRGLWRVLAAMALVMLAAGGVRCSAQQRPGSRQRSVVVRRRVALLVGNAAYVNVARLANPENDVRAVADVLRAIGFGVNNVQVRTNLASGQLRGTVERFVEDLHAGDLALIYYAGHGVSVGNNNYLLPTDFAIELADDLPRHLEARAYSVEQLLSAVGSRASMNVLVFDACRNNPWAERARSVRDVTVARSVGRGLQIVTAPRNSLVVFATGPGQVADDGDGHLSVFTEAFVRRVRDVDHVESMFRNVTADVEDRTGREQTPWRQSSLRDEVFLAALNEDNEPVAAAPTPAETPRVQAPSPPPTTSPITQANTAPALVEAPLPSAASAPASSSGTAYNPTLMELVGVCRSGTGSESARNTCIINVMRGRADTQQELGLLAATLQTENRRAEAERAMRQYLLRYPQGPLANNFIHYLR